MTTVAVSKPRLHNLDYLRGIAAFGIVIYHYLTWTYGNFSAETFLGRVGLYGVAIFYVLSGLTLCHVYYDKMHGREGVQKFFVRRIFRIFPLLWLVTISAVILSRRMPDLMDLFLNLTGLFGFVKWDTYLSTGVWSIGNELVFYAIFPFLVMSARTNKWLLAGAGLLLLAPYLYFSFWAMSPTVPIAEQWRDYVNPLNQAFLFFGGFVIGVFIRKLWVPQFATWLTLAVCIALFIMWPVSGETSALVTGPTRLVFTLICFVICAAAYKLAFTLPNIVHKPLSTLGEASYSLYLIHPLVFGATVFALKELLPSAGVVIIAIVFSLIASWISYRFFETYFMRLGRRITSRKPASSEIMHSGQP